MSIARRERRCLQLAPSLRAGRHRLSPEEIRALNQLLNPCISRARDAAVGGDPGLHGESRGVAIEEGGDESFERVVPVVIAGIAAGLVTPLNGSQKRDS